MTTEQGGLRWGVATDPGRVRADNEDAHLAAGTVFVVADGMGGHQAGEVASALAIDRLRQRFAEGPDPSPRGVAAVVAAIGDVNTDIHEAATRNADQQGMGTTVTSLVIVDDPVDGDVFALTNVGDSRAYLVRRRRMRQLTVDHSYVQELVAEGHITPADARHHPRRNIVTRALGIERDVVVDSWTLPIVRGDRFVLCSDGLVDEVDDAEIEAILLANDDPQAAADALVAAALDHGGRDNVTVLVVDVLEGAEPPEPTEEIDIVPSWASADADATAQAQAATAAEDVVIVEAATQAAADEQQFAEPLPPDVEAHVVRPEPRRRRRRLAIFLAVVGLAAVGVFGFAILAAWARDGYFVAFDEDGAVTIYRGREDGVLWFDPTVEAPTDLNRDELDDVSISRVEATPRFTTRQRAEAFVGLSLTTTTTTTTTTSTTSTTSTTTTTLAPSTTTVATTGG